MRSTLTEISLQLVQVLEEVGFTPAALQEYLGPAAFSSIARGEPASILYTLRTREEEPLAILIQAFLVHAEVPRRHLDSVLGVQIIDALLTLGMAQEKDSLVTIGIDIRSTLIDGRLVWVFSDMDASMVAGHVPGKDHVLGIGAASLSLLSTTPRTPVHALLDLGAGSGIQSLGQAPYARTIVATDVHDRALDFAEANGVANKVSLDIRSGSWFEPVSGEKFDRIVANPPFVVGPPEIGHVYRDSGLDLDGAPSALSEVESSISKNKVAFMHWVPGCIAKKNLFQHELHHGFPRKGYQHGSSNETSSIALTTSTPG